MIGQRDSKWSGILLGHGDGTIGQYGCVITSITDALNAAGYVEETPATVNAKLKNVQGGFIGSTRNLVDWNKLKEVFTIGYEGSYNYDNVPAPMGKLQEYLDQGKEVILRVSARNIGGSGDHFVRAKAIQGNNVIIRDPWFAEEALITKRYTNGSVDTATEIILGFRVMNVVKKPGGNMLEDEMIIKKDVFTKLVNNSNQRDSIFDAFGIDKNTGTAQQIIDIYIKLKEERKSLNEALEKAQNDAKEYKNLYETEKITSDERRKKYDHFIEYIADKLGTIVDAEIIKGKIEELLHVETELSTAKDAIENMKLVHAKEKIELQRELDSLKDQVKLKQDQIDDLAKKIDILSEKIENNNNDEVVNNKLHDIIAGIMLFFEKLGSNRRNTQAKKENENEIQTKNG